MDETQHLFNTLRALDKSEDPQDRREWERIRERLCELHRPMVVATAKRMVATLTLDEGNDLEDLIGVGLEVLVKAINDFDPMQRVTFAHFVITRMEGAMRHYKRDKSALVRVSRHEQEKRLLAGDDPISMQAHCVGLPGQFDEGGTSNGLDEAAAPSFTLGDVAVARAVFASFLSHLDMLAANATGRPREALQRERRVIELHFRSKATIEIARLLDCSESNVALHIRNGLARLKQFANCEN